MLNFDTVTNLAPFEKLAYCNTQYPTILVSGLGFQDQNKVTNYWGKVPEYLKLHGADVYLAKQHAFLSIPDNAIRLKYRILDILESTKKDKINIIGHSKGGLEARYVAGKLGIHGQIASITTLGTPHQGAHLADIVLGKIPIPNFAMAQLTNIYARILGDSQPDSFRAVLQVSTQQLKKFNAEVPDIDSIYCQSYAGHINKDYPGTMWRTLAGILKPYDGKNDGLVGVESAKWQNYKGLIATEDAPSVSHGDMIGFAQTIGEKKFNARAFIAYLLHDLKERGC